MLAGVEDIPGRTAQVVRDLEQAYGTMIPLLLAGILLFTVSAII